MTPNERLRIILETVRQLQNIGWEIVGLTDLCCAINASWVMLHGAPEPSLIARRVYRLVEMGLLERVIIKTAYCKFRLTDKGAACDVASLFPTGGSSVSGGSPGELSRGDDGDGV